MDTLLDLWAIDMRPEVMVEVPGVALLDTSGIGIGVDIGIVVVVVVDEVVLVTAKVVGLE